MHLPILHYILAISLTNTYKSREKLEKNVITSSSLQAIAPRHGTEVGKMGKQSSKYRKGKSSP